MDFELRSILLVVGVVVIAAILIHGLISIRQANQPVDLSGIDLGDKDSDGGSVRDGSGFDRYGVGVARVINASDETSLNLDDSAGPINFDVALEQPDQPIGKVQATDDLTAEQPISPVFDSPVFREKPASQLPEQDQSPLAPGPSDIPPEDKAVNAIAGTATEANAIAEPAPSQEPLDVLVLNVIAGDDDELNGTQLLPILLTLGFKFGDMDIFHRHADSAGHGTILFSLANMVNPGVFDIDNMEQFTTGGVSLFMTLPHSQGNLETFNLMLNAAAKIAEEFSGQVLDGERSTLTKRSIQHYVERIREVERKLLLTK